MSAFERRTFLAGALVAALAPNAARAAAPRSAAAREKERGPEADALARRAGLWRVTETAWNGPGSAPQTSTGLVAERRMIGSMLQEVLRPADDRAGTRIARIDLLLYDRIEGRWEYVSMDAREPVGLMPGKSFSRGDGRTIEIVHEPFAVPGPGAAVTGQLLRMNTVIDYTAAARDEKNQHFILADGIATEWLGHRYRYERIG